jgi:lysophospholipase L1-like esterase
VSALLSISSAADQVQKGDVVAICGDTLPNPKGYSAMIEMYLLVCQQNGPIRTAQFCLNNDPLRYLMARGVKPVLEMHPTVVTLSYGMEDGYFLPLKVLQPSGHFPKFSDNLKSLIHELKANGVRMIVVGSPGAVKTENFVPRYQNNIVDYNATLAVFRDVARQAAKDEGCPFADVYDLMLDVMAKAKIKYGDKYHVCGANGWLPAENGQLVMAYAFLRAMGCSGDIGKIVVDIAKGNATATTGHRIVSYNSGEIKVESSRYPFCFSGKPDDPAATAGIIEFFPFNDNLNRFNLVVNGLSASEKVRVRWGSTSKTFSASEAANGINLAAEYLNNPFSESFKKILAAVRKKQDWETPFYRDRLGRISSLKNDIKDIDPDLAKSLDQLVPALIQVHARMSDTLSASVVPVIHAVKVEVVK